MELMAGASGNGSNQVTDIIGQFSWRHHLANQGVIGISVVFYSADPFHSLADTSIPAGGIGLRRGQLRGQSPSKP